MQPIPSADLNILNKAQAQLSHFITAAHRANNAHLLSPAPLPPATAAGAPDTTSLNDLLNNAVKAPGTTSIATVPSSVPAGTDILYGLLSQVQTLDSYISLLTAFCLYNEHPGAYDIARPDQASAFTRAMAKWRNYVITGGGVKAMAGYLPVTSVVAQNYNQQVTSATLHLEFLAALFGGFGLPKVAMAELDSILSKVTQQLGSLNLSFESADSSLDHFLTYYYFATVPGTGGPDQPPAMYQAKVRTFFLHIDQESWRVSVGKSKVEHFQFRMNFFDMDTAMNPVLVGADMAAIQSTIQTLTGQTAAEVNQLMNMQAIHADPQK
jgi:hypothetical protein